jgi:hypothetical protein
MLATCKALIHCDRPFLRETSAFVTKELGLISITTSDNPSAVNFGWEDIWHTIKSSNVKITAATMIHSHPDYIATMSSIDEDMVKGWRIALGIPIDFLVVCKRTVAIYRCDIVNRKVENELLAVQDFKDIDESGLRMHLLCKTIHGLSRMDMRDINSNNILDFVRYELQPLRFY